MNTRTRLHVFVLLAVGLLSVGGLVGYRTYTNGTNGLPTLNSDAVHEYAWSQYKATCTTFDAMTSPDLTYRNVPFGIAFLFPADAIVCERIMPDVAGDELEVSVISTYDFDSDSGGRGPRLVLRVGNALAQGLPQPVVLERATSSVGGLEAVREKVQPQSCAHEPECPMMTLYTITRAGSTVIIEDRWGNPDVIESFTFLSAE